MSPHSHRSRLALVLAVVAATAAPACAPVSRHALDEASRRRVVVSYSPLLRCEALAVAESAASPGQVTYQPGPFLVFGIHSIMNDAAAAQDFEFAASRLFVDPSPTSRAHPTRTSGATRIAAGTTWSREGRVIMKIDPPAGPTASWRYLRYEPEQPDVSVVMMTRGRAPDNRDACTPDQLPSLPDLP